MCGIAGFCSFEKYFLPDGEPWKRILIEMRKSIAHRGPDSAGEYLCEHAGLSHARLSIRDPALGSQPMVRTVDGADYVIVYNGEIYNVDEIKPNLVRAGCRFETTTDTEVILYSYITYGDDFVKMLNGIFAFAIWDGARKQLILYRDRLGVKPLFYTVKSNTLIFGSEIKALFCHPQVSPGIDMNSFREIFGTGPARTPGNGVFRDIYEVMPGHYILYSNGNFIDKQYWKLEAREHTDNYEQTLETVSFMVRDAIVRQMVADVPVCTFLSGGIDSSIVTAVAANYLRSGSPGNGRATVRGTTQTTVRATTKATVQEMAHTTAQVTVRATTYVATRAKVQTAAPVTAQTAAQATAQDSAHFPSISEITTHISGRTPSSPHGTGRTWM